MYTQPTFRISFQAFAGSEGKGGHEPRKAGSLQELEKARKDMIL